MKEKKEKASITIQEFLAKYSNAEACLQHLFETRFGQGHVCTACNRAAKWYRIEAERAYSCQWCGNHLHPTVGTPFEDSRTPLQLWFYAIYLFTTSRHGVPAKELERQLGVTYKTAWRMAHLIRQHMEYVDGVSGQSKPAREGRMKTSHFEGRIALGAADAAQGRDEYTQREPATFDFDLGGAWLVAPADCAR